MIREERPGACAVADDELSAPLGQEAKAKPRRFKLPIAHLPQVDRRGARPVRLRLCRLGAVRQRPARRRADRDGGDRSRPGQARDARGGVGQSGARTAQLRRPGEAVTIRSRRPCRRNCAQPPATAAARGTARNTVTIIDGSTGKRQEVPIAGAAGRRARRSSSACSKAPRHGAIPRIAPDGARPAEAYARAAKPPPATTRTVRASPSC